MGKTFSALGRIKVAALSIVMLGSAVVSPFALSESSGIAEATAGNNYDIGNYAKALQYSIYFYDANMCGTGVEDNNLYTWRGNCHTYDAEMPMTTEATNLSESFIAQYGSILDPDGDGLIDVAGGFHDAGDHVKFGMPESYSGSTLGWGYYEFRDAYAATGQDAHMETILRYFNDYFMKCTFRDENGDVIAFCYQVGEGEIDHAYWNAPEIDDMFRKGFFLTPDKPQTDYVVSTAASLAVNYLNFKDTDKKYAEKCLDYAKALHKFAQENNKELSDNADGPRAFYGSSKWEDDYVWSAAWLFLCTEDVSYLEDAMQYVDYYAPSGWMHCWNDVWNGAITLLGEIDIKYPELELQNMYREIKNKTVYEDADFWIQIQKTLDKWQDDFDSPGGYAFFSVWGSARYNTAAQLLALVYDKYKNNGKPSKYSTWAQEQMDYLMGDNPLERGYIVGFNEISAKFPHHRAASGLSKCEDPGTHKHVLYGALVGGPDGSDQHNDTTEDWIYNEVTIDYNAAFVGACAGLYTFFGNSGMAVTPDFPPEEEETGSEGGGDDFWVEAFSVDIVQEAPKVSEITFYVCTNSIRTAKNISVRYYFDSAGMSSVNINDLELRQLYDQTAAETDYKATLSGPHLYQGSIYYIEISWDGYSIANSNKKYQFALGTYAFGNSWNPDDDWSHTGIKQETDAFQGVVERTDYICVYNSGVLIGGIEPDGTKPEKLYDSSDLLKLKKYITGKTKPSQSSAAAYDLNESGVLDIPDTVVLKRKLMGIT